MTKVTLKRLLSCAVLSGALVACDHETNLLESLWEVSGSSEWRYSNDRIALNSNDQVLVVAHQLDNSSNESTAYVANYSQSGQVNWEVSIEDAGFSDLWVDSTGDVVAAGAYGINDVTGFTVEGVLLAKYDADGQLLWQTTQESDPFESVRIEGNQNGDIWVTYTTDRQWQVIKFDSFGTLQWQYSHTEVESPKLPFLAVDSNGYSYLAETVDRDYYLTQIDQSGNFSWSASVDGTDKEGTGIDWVTGLAVNSNDQVVISGSTYDEITTGTVTNSNSLITTVNYDVNGAQIWKYTLEPADGVDTTFSTGQMLIDENDNVYISARQISTTGFVVCPAPGAVCPIKVEFDVVIKLNNIGELIWNANIKRDTVYSGMLDIGPNGNVYRVSEKFLSVFNGNTGALVSNKAVTATRVLSQIKVDSSGDIYLSQLTRGVSPNFIITKYINSTL